MPAHPLLDFNHERLWLACTSIRLARVCVEDAFAYANIRETFGRKLIENQTIRSKFSTMGKLLHPAQSYMEQIVYLTGRGHAENRDTHLGGLIALLKVMAGQALETVTRESQQIMGGLGYSRTGRGARIEQISRDVRVMVVGGGSEEILLDLAVSQETRAMKLLGKSSKL
jgi:alkylation response protein AidB-like acyl-CoA dehydrogenase